MEEKITMSQRVAQWTKKNATTFTFKFNKTKHKDIIEKLQSVDNRTQYLIDLIRADMGKPETTITLSDLAKMMTDNEKARLEFVIGTGTPTIWHTTKREIENDTRVVKEWHRDSDNILCAKVKVR